MARGFRMNGRSSFASSHDAASYAAAPPALNRARESLLEFFEAREKPHILAAIRLGHESAQGGALSQEARDVADDHEPPSILHNLLDQLARDARAERKEIVVKAIDGNNDQRGVIFERLADQVDGVVVGPQPRSVGHAFEDAHTVKFVKF